jgi:stearoyl-CoA desaturase (delta-9 desaturase)
MSTTSSSSPSSEPTDPDTPATGNSGTDPSAPTGAPVAKLDHPETTQPLRLAWDYTIALTLVHVLACLAFVPWLFSWTGVALIPIGHLTFGMMGITIGYHRLLTHQGFTCSKWLEYTLAIMGICCLQDSPARWVAIHRVHHKHSDEQPDPHSPLVNFLWGHMAWLFFENRDHVKVGNFERYVRDLLRDPFYLKLERNALWLGIYVLHALAFFAVGYTIGYVWPKAEMTANMSGLQFGSSLLVWGVFVRTVVVLHGTWAVNSLSHTFGYQNYQTGDSSRNNWLVALLSHGEGWHNNHHADQRAASHGHRWWELDMSWWVILTLEKLGLIKNVVRPRCWSESSDSKAH